MPVTYASLKNRDIDVFLGNWMPSMEGDARPFLEDGSVESVGANLEGAKYTLAVPSYLAEQGLKDFADIANFRDQLDGQIYGIEPGNDGNRLILQMIEENAFGLDGFELVESSEQGMLAQVARATRSEEPIVFLGWAPHPMNANFDLAYLSGGDEWFGPDFGGATVYTNVRAGYLEECPNVGQLLKNPQVHPRDGEPDHGRDPGRGPGARGCRERLAQGASGCARGLAGGRHHLRGRARPARGQGASGDLSRSVADEPPGAAFHLSTHR